MPSRQGTACQGRLVENCAARLDDAVDRHDIALADQQPVARRDLADRDALELRTGVAKCGLRRARKERGHLVPGAASGNALQELPAGIHQADNIPGQRNAECQRCAHGQRGDDVQPDLPMAQRDDDFEFEHCKGSHRADGPRRPCELTVPRRAGDPAGNQRSADCQQQHNVGQPLDSGGDPGRPLQ